MMAAKEIFGRLKTLPQLQQRKAAAILGAIVSDAASKISTLDSLIDS